MATTTNYSWTTPDDTALVKDGASAIRSLGTAVDTTTKALNPSTTLGDIEYRSSTANTNTRLGIGTAGQVLQVNSGATAPEWATPAPSVPANEVAKVATSQSTTSGSYTDLATSGPAVTLTTGTKALVIVTTELVNAGGANFGAYMAYAVSGATTIAATNDTCLKTISGSGGATDRLSAASIVTLTAGSNTFTAKYKSDFGGTSTFNNREINVINLA
jgi:hypothetical protein